MNTSTSTSASSSSIEKTIHPITVEVDYSLNGEDTPPRTPGNDMNEIPVMPTGRVAILSFTLMGAAFLNVRRPLAPGYALFANSNRLSQCRLW
jgi:hypothetical protein